MIENLSCFLDRELKDYIFASQLLVGALEGLDLPLCAVPVLGVKVNLHHRLHSRHMDSPKGRYRNTIRFSSERLEFLGDLVSFL